MNSDPAKIIPHGDFSEFADTAPTDVAVAGTFRLALSHNGIGLGWMGRNSSNYAVLAGSASEAIQLELYPYNGVDYYRLNGSNRYLSVSNNAYVGFYLWNGATGWKQTGTRFVSDYNGQSLSLYSKDNGYLYAYDPYTVLEVTFESQ
ncbi:hypothetical protein [Burkholderia plantarii]|uniref:hypothetical protein n=1 Tax=Burkholderia plantarii TaxID=41899 RepID=UPI0018DE4CDE|nr:hypothetical protein [Burkholderia plantarii]MBI0331642.1 hypothetical protein [Burkholderia plantarii]